MDNPVRILHLEDDPADAELVEASLESAGMACRVTRVQTRDEFRQALAGGGHDVILADYTLPTYDGVSALQLARELCPDVPFIFVSGTMGEDAAIEALTAGAADYVLKHKLSRLAAAVKRALREAENWRERKRAEESLRASEERFRALFENSPVPIWEEDLSAVRSLLDDLKRQGVADIEAFLEQRPDVVERCVSLVRITDVNRAALAMHEAAGKQELIEGLPRTSTPESYAIFRRVLAAVWDGGTEMETDAVVQTLSGNSRHVTMYLSVCPGHERTLSRILLSFVDITERKRAEESLRESARRSAEAEKLAATGRMAAMVAHEINSPLAGIKNAFRLVLDAVPLDHPDRDMAERIEREIDRIAHIVRQMYEVYSPRIEEPTDVPVGAIVRDVLTLLEPLRRERRVTFEVGAIAPELTVRAHPGSLQQVLYNLVVNAIQASPCAGVVRVAAESAGGDGVRISVSDQGPGIPAEMQSRVFEPFVTANTGAAPKQALGLGLAIVKSLVDSLGGRVEFNTVVGEGTCFRVCLPAKQP